MRIALRHFSGTGNTAWVAERLAAHLVGLGDEVDVGACGGLDEPPARLGSCEALGLLFPVHGSFAPRPFRDFVDRLPAGEGRPLFALATAGYWAGDAAWYATRPLVRRGWDPFLIAEVRMPNNIRLPWLSQYPVPSRDVVKRRLPTADRRIGTLAGLIHGRTRHVEGTDPLGRAYGFVQRTVFHRAVSLAFPGFLADPGCTGCGWCVRHCPVGNIEPAGSGVRFGTECILCMRCYSFCPASAIQAGARTRDTSRFPRYAGPEGRPYDGPGNTPRHG
jgi:ferredoxin